MDGRKQENHRDESSPSTCPHINISREFSRVNWSRGEILRPKDFAHDWDTTTPIDADCSYLHHQNCLDESAPSAPNGRGGGV